MCYWVGTKKVREEMMRRLEQNPEDEIAQLFYKTFVGKSDLRFMEYYVAIGKARPPLSVMVSDEERGLHFRNMNWGYQWNYTNPKTGKTYERELINSTCEKVFFVHRDVIFKNRCVVPLDGYYEFFHFSGQVYPHFMHPAEGLFWVAGVWQERVDRQTGEVIEEFSLITSPPNALAEKLHNNPKAPNGSRMLLILPDDKVLEYLNPTAGKEDLEMLFKPYPSEKMHAYPTVRFLKKEFAGKLGTDEVRRRVDYPELFFA
ncbi:MAG: SOS response-associated peptidase [Bacteroidota bacterium]